MMRIGVAFAALILMVLLPGSSDRPGPLLRGTARTPVMAAPTRVKVLTWNTHAGRDAGRHLVVSQQIAWVRSLRADGVRVVNLNAVREEDLDDWQQVYPHAVFAPAGGQRGEKLYTLLLSEFPFQVKEVINLGVGMRAAFVDLHGVSLRVYGLRLNVCAKTDTAAYEQASTLVRTVRERSDPARHAIAMGDFNVNGGTSPPGGAPQGDEEACRKVYRLFDSAGWRDGWLVFRGVNADMQGGNTFVKARRLGAVARIDYIWLLPPRYPRLRSMTVLEPTANTGNDMSDHFPVLGELELE